MFKLNFHKLLPNLNYRREQCDMTIKTWKIANKKEYTNFKKRIDNIKDGDLSILLEMFSLMKRCTPPEALIFYQWFESLINGKVCFEDMATGKILWAGEHTEVIAKCVTNGLLWLGINLKTGEVKIYDSQQPDLLMVKSDTAIELWNALPQYHKSYIIDQINGIVQDTKIFDSSNAQELKILYAAIAFFAKIFVMSHAVFLSGFMANLYDEVIEKKEALAYCMYYFVVFDHGLIKMANLLNHIINEDNVDSEGMVFINNCLSMLVNQSINNGLETKERWNRTAEECNPAIWKEIMCALRSANTNQGNKKVVQSLEEILIGNHEELFKHIRQFLIEYPDSISLAYLLRSLQEANRIKSDIRYMTFHRAIEHFTQQKYGHDIPQKRFGEIKGMSLTGKQHSLSYIKAKHIIERWTPIFAKHG